jgi:hypothetical protein
MMLYDENRQTCQNQTETRINMAKSNNIKQLFKKIRPSCSGGHHATTALVNTLILLCQAE